jgi:hypothetical protein
MIYCDNVLHIVGFLKGIARRHSFNKKNRKIDAMAREDISDFLIHFTKGDTHETAFARLRTILTEKRLIGSNLHIKGKHTCVCLSEAPLAAMEKGLLNSSAYSRYSPFGVLFNKPYIFAKGGRPVIYQPHAEYILLPASLNWRHVTYDPTGSKPTDFTWEREWRIHAPELKFDGTCAAAVVPDSTWADRLIEAHEEDERYRVVEYMQIMDENIVIQDQEDFEWFIFTLSRR